MLIGIIGAMEEEVDSILGLLSSPKKVVLGGRTFTQGTFLNNQVVVVYSRVGKASAASTATTLINHFNVDKIIFTGVAGAVDEALHVGDIVIGDQCIQHDMDASPLFPKFEIPLTNASYFMSCDNLVAQALQAAQKYIKEDFPSDISASVKAEFKIIQPAVKVGTIASGDQFISSSDKIKQLRIEIDNLLAVEMEGAAVSQICSEYQIPFVIIRTISDKANENSPHDFNRFLTEITTHFAKGIIKQFLTLIK